MTTEFRAKGSTGEIWLYDQIGPSFWGDGITDKQFQKELTALGKVTTINLRINSPGGDVFHGTTIYNLLKSHPARVVVDIDGLAASIASVVAMAGDEIRIAGNAMLMIHNPHGMAVGDAIEMRRTAALLDQVKVNLADTYAARTGNGRAQVEAWMEDETWLTADAAVQMGFADAVTQEQRVAACFQQLQAYHKVPPLLRKLQATAMDTPARRDITAVRIQQQYERLRAAGAAP
jgi:ATP-dependent Clp protease, protease subunit